MIQTGRYVLYYKVECISYRKDRIYFVPSHRVSFVLYNFNKPLLFYSCKTNYDLNELKNEEDYRQILKIVKNFRKKGLYMFVDEKDKIISKVCKYISPNKLRDFLLFLVSVLKTVDNGVIIITDSYFGKIWLSNFRVKNSYDLEQTQSYQIINKQRVFQNSISVCLDNCEIDKKIESVNVHNMIYKLIRYHNNNCTTTIDSIINIMKQYEIND